MAERRLEEVRTELRRRGYLDHSVERFFLQDALRPERPGRTLVQLSAKVALSAGLPLALLLALALAIRNGHLGSAPFDLLPLTLHLLPLALALPGLAFLLLAGVLALVLRFSHARRIGAVSFALALAAAGTAVLAVVWQGHGLYALLPLWQKLLLAPLPPLLAFLLVKVVHGALLGLSIRLTERAPERRPSSRRPWLALGATALLVVALVPALLDAGHREPRTPASLPSDPAARVLAIGIDGILPEELDYLLESGELPALEARLRSGGALAAYDRPEGVPASFWTSVATGLAAADHGMDSVDGYRPLGMERALRWSGWLRHYWSLVAPLGLVKHRAMLAHQRAAFTFWELAARGGAPVLVVGWWGTYPVEPLPGLVIAHGAYPMLTGAAGTAEGAVAPADAAVELAALASDRTALLAATPLPPALAGRDELLDKALLPDAFYLEAFRRGLESPPRAAALYLSAVDIAAGLEAVGSLATGDLVRWQLQAVDSLLAGLEGVGTVVLVFDPGRRGERSGEGDDDTLRQGRALLWRAEPCAEAPTAVLGPEALASALLRGLGLPQSRELPDPPPHCPWPPPGLTVDTFGRRTPPPPEARGEEYLENLRSLGYL